MASLTLILLNSVKWNQLKNSKELPSTPEEQMQELNDQVDQDIDADANRKRR